MQASSKQIQLTNTQKLMLTGQQLQAGQALYNMIMVYKIQGDISGHHFNLAFDALVKNCDAMRLVFSDSLSEPKQHILSELRYKVAHIDFSKEQDANLAYKEWESQQKKHNFDLSQCLFDCALINLGNNEYIWYLNQHHLCTDAWSTQLIFNYVSQAYALSLHGKLQDLPALPSFSSYAECEHAANGSRAFLRAQKFWQTKQNIATRPNTFYTGKSTAKSVCTYRHKLVIDPRQESKLKKLLSKADFMAFSEDMSLMQVFATVLFAYLYRLSKNENLIIGTPSHGRTSANLKKTIGTLINVFSLHVQCTDQDSFRSLYKKVAQANQDLLINAIAGANQTENAHQFDVVLNYLPSTFGDFASYKTSVDWVHPDAGDQNHLLRLQIVQFNKNQPPSLLFDLNSEVFKEQESKYLKTHFMLLFDTFLENPDELIGKPSLLAGVEAQSVNHLPNPANLLLESCDEEHSQNVLHLLQTNLDKVVATQKHPAVLVEGERQISARMLMAKSDYLAHKLMNEACFSRDLPIAILLPRSINAVIAIMAVIKTGASFLPLDLDLPQERLEYIVRDAKVQLVLASGNDEVKLLEDTCQMIDVEHLLDKSALPTIQLSLPLLQKDDLAYVIYTSGSTGQAKGVEVTHGGLYNYLSWAKAYYLKGSSLNFPLFSSLSFDLTITSLFLPLISEGCLFIYPQNEVSGISIIDVIEDNRVDIIKLTPAHLALIQQMDFANSTIKKLIVGGDDFKTELALLFYRYFASNIEIYNEYGPTETTVACAVHKFNPSSDRSASVPIGRPISNTQIYLLDSFLNPVPQGCSGEIYVAGAGLAKAYLNQPALSAERFINYPLVNTQGQSVRLYKTGDLATYNAQGILNYLGRNDRQVKVNGVRIETAEVESVLLSMDKVDDCIVDLAKNLGLSEQQDEHELAVEHCRKCGLAANHPSAQLNHDKICRLCLVYKKQEALAKDYYKDLPSLQAWIDRIKAKNPGKQDSIMLLSGGKDSSYTLCKLVDMGLTPLVFTLDNGFISEGAKANIKRLVDRLGLELVIGQTDAMNDIFVDSLERFSNVCNGCFKTIYTMSMKIAKERNISVICTGLSRGQIFETRVAHLFQQGCFSPQQIDQRIIDARKAYHRTEDIISRRLDVQVFQDDKVFEQIQYLDYFRYTDVTLDEMYDYLHNIAPWIRPSDTGRSTNCLINDAGIYVHKKERGYHNYALPYSWDVRLGHKERDAALDELDDEIDQQKVDQILLQVGYQVKKPNTSLQKADVLVAYYCGPGQIQKNELQEHIAKRLPKEYLPSQFIWLPSLPLNTNGKVDRQALPKPQQSLRELSIDYIPPSSEFETRLASLWSMLLGVKEVGIADNFFDLGGDSIVNIQIVAGAREAGIDISPQQVFDNPTIQELAKVATKLQVFHAAQENISGSFLCLPGQASILNNLSTTILVANEPKPEALGQIVDKTSQYCQSVLLNCANSYSEDVLVKAFNELVKHHDALRSRFFYKQGSWYQEIIKESKIWINPEQISFTQTAEINQCVEEKRAQLQKTLSVQDARLLAACQISDTSDEQSYLLIVVNSFVIDYFSWWVLLKDLSILCQQIHQQEPKRLDKKTCSLLQWRQSVDQYLRSKAFEDAEKFWLSFYRSFHQPLSKNSQNSLKIEPKIDNQTSSKTYTQTIEFSKEQTRLLSNDVPAAYSIKLAELLLAALVDSTDYLAEIGLAQTNQLAVLVESHGREEITKGLLLTRTIGNFRNSYPLVLKPKSQNVADVLSCAKETLRNIPNNGFDHDLLAAYSHNQDLLDLLQKAQMPAILFSFDEAWDINLAYPSAFTTQREAFVSGSTIASKALKKSTTALAVHCQIVQQQLVVELKYDPKTINEHVLKDFATRYTSSISALREHCLQENSHGLSVSDFPSAQLDADELDDLFAEFGED